MYVAMVSILALFGLTDLSKSIKFVISGLLRMLLAVGS